MAKFSEQLKAFCGLAIQLADLHHVESILLMVERPTDWKTLQQTLKSHHVVVAGDVDSGVGVGC